jgi:uncharacterized Zn ribbon protein
VEDTSVNSVVNSSLGKVSTTPASSYGVSYAWEPANIIMREEHSMLMKFTDAVGNIIKNGKDYNILIKDPNTNGSVIFEKHGSTPTGVDLKIIDGNSFPIRGSQFNPVNYDLEIHVNNVGGNTVREHAS